MLKKLKGIENLFLLKGAIKKLIKCCIIVHFVI